MYSSEGIGTNSGDMVSPQGLLVVDPFADLHSSNSGDSEIPAVSTGTPPQSVSTVGGAKSQRSFTVHVLAVSFFFELASTKLPTPSVADASWYISVGSELFFARSRTS